MISTEEYNELVRAAARTQQLGGTVRQLGGGDIWHHWMTSAERQDDRLWRVYVSPGAVNERVASITYLRRDDPRGWTPPANHPSIAVMQRVYGDDYRYLDRSLTEQDDPPYLLLTTPDTSTDLGDFRRVADSERLPIPFFRTAEMWDLELYSASVFLTAAPRHYSRVEDSLHFPAPTKVTRFRVALAAQLPIVNYGATYGGNKELARLFLTRSPGDPSTDTLWVEQRCFWSLGTVNVEPTAWGDTTSNEAFLTGNIVVDNITDIILTALAALLEGTSSIQFWSAA